MFDSPVSLVDDTYAVAVGGSFQIPLTDPGPSPTDAPLVCVEINIAWLEILAGCALQVCMPASWTAVDDPTLDALVDKAHLLLLAVATADYCMQSGTVSLTILAGASTAAATVTFPNAFTATADVVVSESTGLYIASSYSPSTTGVGVSITSDVPVLVNSTATLTWIARAHV